jgi:hypothetical protein
MTGYLHRAALVVGLAGALAVSGCSSSGSVKNEGAPLNAEEIKTVLVGNSVVGENWDGPFTVYFPIYGIMRGVRAGHYKDMGTWRTEADSICGTWENWWGSMERCWGISLDGETVSWLRPDSDTSEKAKLVEGNPYGL